MAGRRIIHFLYGVIFFAVVNNEWVRAAEVICQDAIPETAMYQSTPSNQCQPLVREGRPQSFCSSADLDVVINGTGRTVTLFPAFSNLMPSLGGIMLHGAVSLRVIDLVRDLINLGSSLNIADKRGVTPLYYALASDFDQAAQVLVKCGADVNFSMKDGSLLHLAVRNRSLKIVKKLVQLGAIVNTENNQCYTPLFLSIKLNEIDIAKYLIENGADINYKTRKGLTLLHNAVLENDIETASDTIRLGANCDITDNDGKTPIYISIKLSYSQITDLLLENGADVNSISPGGNSLLHIAVYEGDIHVVQELIDLHANVSAEDARGLTPVHWAVNQGNIEILLFLIRLYNTSQKVLSESGDYLIHYAIRRGSIASTVVLIEFENLKVQNRKGLTPFALAVYLNRTEIIDLFLEELGEMDLTYKINSENKWYTPLHMVAMEGNLDAAQNLIKYGANVNSKDSEGHTPLWNAAEFNNSAMIDLLIKNGANTSNMSNDSSFELINLAIKNRCADCVESLLCTQIGKKLLSNSHLDTNRRSQYDYSETGSNKRIYLENLKKSNLLYNSEILTLFTKDPNIYLLDERIKLMRSAIKSGSNDIVKTLLNHGLVTKKTESFDSFLITALENREPLILDTLIKHGANMTTNVKVYIETPAGKIPKHWSLLHHAAFLDFLDESKVLIENGMDVNIRDSKLWTPLHIAAMTINYEMCKLLVDNGAELGVRTAGGYTPYYIAEQKSAYKIMNLLKIPD